MKLRACGKDNLRSSDLGSRIADLKHYCPIQVVIVVRHDHVDRSIACQQLAKRKVNTETKTNTHDATLMDQPGIPTPCRWAP